MRNTEKVTAAAIQGRTLKAAALSCDGQGIYSYAELIAKQTGPKEWNVIPAGLFSVTTSKHCNGVANELRMHGMTVTRNEN